MKVEIDFAPYELAAVCILSSTIGLLCVYGLVQLGAEIARGWV